MIAILPKGLDELLWEGLSVVGSPRRGLIELYRQSNNWMIWLSDHWNVRKIIRLPTMGSSHSKQNKYQGKSPFKGTDWFASLFNRWMNLSRIIEKHLAT